LPSSENARSIEEAGRLFAQVFTDPAAGGESTPLLLITVIPVKVFADFGEPFEYERPVLR
jgi:hypothetical protein